MRKKWEGEGRERKAERNPVFCRFKSLRKLSFASRARLERNQNDCYTKMQAKVEAIKAYHSLEKTKKLLRLT